VKATSKKTQPVTFCFIRKRISTVYENDSVLKMIIN